MFYLVSFYVGEAISVIRNHGIGTSSSQIYVWSDMFDPHHNAHDNYYLVNGDISGSWNGLPCDTIVMNWNLGNLNTSLTWFANLGINQIVAGYYDSGDGTTSGEQGKVFNLSHC